MSVSYKPIGTRARTYHSTLSPEEREDLKSDFRSNERGTVTVLIMMYRVGLNLDGHLGHAALQVS